MTTSANPLRLRNFCTQICTLPALNWCRSDKRWFSNNPTRSYRLRRMIPGEWPLENAENHSHTIVCQIAPGHRVRIPCGLICKDGGKKLDEFPGDDVALSVLYRLCCDTTAPVTLSRFYEEAMREMSLANLAGGQ